MYSVYSVFTTPNIVKGQIKPYCATSLTHSDTVYYCPTNDFKYYTRVKVDGTVFRHKYLNLNNFFHDFLYT